MGQMAATIATFPRSTTSHPLKVEHGFPERTTVDFPIGFQSIKRDAGSSPVV